MKFDETLLEKTIETEILPRLCNFYYDNLEIINENPKIGTGHLYTLLRTYVTKLGEAYKIVFSATNMSSIYFDSDTGEIHYIMGVKNYKMSINHELIVLLNKILTNTEYNFENKFTSIKYDELMVKIRTKQLT